MRDEDYIIPPLPKVRTIRAVSAEKHDALRTIAAQLAEALREVEWEGPPTFSRSLESVEWTCPSCEGFHSTHADDCSLAAALEAWESYQR